MQRSRQLFSTALSVVVVASLGGWSYAQPVVGTTTPRAAASAATSIAAPSIPNPVASSAAWAQWLQGTWEQRSIDKAGQQVEITLVQFSASGEYQTSVQYGPFKAEPSSRGRVRIENASATQADLLFTPVDKDAERQPAEAQALSTRVTRVDANRMRAGAGSELTRKP
ncbi:MAG: hypothetical protein N2483_09140 [Burkholderiaceae bacterium]|nr:hypothetical protein [Burkholderiaceae bacterium]